ncbi:MAG TPA: small multi-drug export protein [Candidatus Nanoarchaeia archaeon]|nr:small multi-drug export protein [Candidatus Nanoarchaeia archaeon]
MNDILWVILLSITPVAELRGSIPYGIFSTDISVWIVVFVAVIFNILVGPAVYLVLQYVVGQFLHIEKFRKGWEHIVLRSQKKLEPLIQKYGVLGMAVFIGIPLPGTGVYTAAIGAYALGYRLRQVVAASIIGVVAAATIVTAVSLFGQGVWTRLFL